MTDRERFCAELESWLSTVVTSEKPPLGVAAFRVGITESEEGYMLYLAGSATYSATDDEWATVPPIFIAESELPIANEEETEWYWQLLEVIYCLGRVLRTARLQQSYLGTTPLYTGFNDGDLYRII